MRVALVKPDDLGDFILAIPAIHALAGAGHDVTVFCKPRLQALARRLVCGVDLRPIVFGHLFRPGLDDCASGSSDLTMLAEFDVVVFLKRDAFLNPQRLGRIAPRALFPAEADDEAPARHEAWTNLDAVRPLLNAEPQSIDKFYSDPPPSLYPDQIGRVGLAIGTGFHTKKWPMLSWLEFIRMLNDRKIQWTILCGVHERRAAECLAEAAGSQQEGCLGIGDDDVDKFLCSARKCDVVVGVDGGTAHLCALAAPVLGLFGPSPFRRFCPVGRTNRVVTLELGCSPCVGADPGILNACMGMECMFALLPAAVMAALDHPTLSPGSTVIVDPVYQARAHFGLSHA